MMVSIFFAHWLACCFWVIGKEHEERDSWIIKAELVDADFQMRYITSLYWALTTMTTVGYGDVSPISTNERLFGMVGMIIAAGVYAYIINNVGKMVSRYNILAA